MLLFAIFLLWITTATGSLHAVLQRTFAMCYADTISKILCPWQADVFNPASWTPQLQGAIGVVSCLGAFGSNDFMYKVSSAALNLALLHVTAANDEMLETEESLWYTKPIMAEFASLIKRVHASMHLLGPCAGPFAAQPDD